MKLFSYLKKGDFFLFLLVLLLAGTIFLFLFRPDTEKKDCVIMKNNAIIKTVSLSDGSSQEFTVTGDYTLTVEIQGERVRVKESDCPNKVCVASGWIANPGQTILCAPNQVIIQIISNQEGEVDGIAY